MPPENETGFTEHESELIFSLYQGHWILLDPNPDPDSLDPNPDPDSLDPNPDPDSLDPNPDPDSLDPTELGWTSGFGIEPLITMGTLPTSSWWMARIKALLANSQVTRTLIIQGRLSLVG
jgi:hypothetical protein